MKHLLYPAFLLLAIPCFAQDQTTTTTQQTTTMPGSATIQMNVGGMGVTTQQTTITTTTTTTNSGGSATQAAPQQTQQQYVPGYNGPVGCPTPMSHDDYESAKSSISQKDFENTKLDMAKQIAGSNCLLAEQVKGIMKLFTFENSKLDFAKFAYTHTYDKGNYFKVNDAFEFDSSSQELNSYVSSH